MFYLVSCFDEDQPYRAGRSAVHGASGKRTHPL